MSARNPYLSRPLLVAFRDGAAMRAAGRSSGGRPGVRAVVAFLGHRSGTVHAAVERAGRASAAGHQPKTGDGAILRKEFGARYAQALGFDLFRPAEKRGGLDDPDGLDDLAADTWESAGAPLDVSGGAQGTGDFETGQLEFGDLSEFAGDVKKPRAAPSPGGVSAVRAARDVLPRYTASPFAIYPTDTMADLGERIFAATGIPPWRLNLSCERPGEEPMHAYDLLLSGVNAVLDVADLYDLRAHELVGGVVPDRRLEEARAESGSVQVMPFDEARQMEYRPGQLVVLVYAADIFDALDVPAVVDAVRDDYARDLLYFGVVIKYWPRLASAEAFVEAFTGRAEPAPYLAGTQKQAVERTRLAMEFLEEVWRRAGAKPPAERVTELELSGNDVRWGVATGVGAVLAAFDRLATGSGLPAAALSLPAQTASALGRVSRSAAVQRRPLVILKRHATSFTGTTPAAVVRLQRAAVSRPLIVRPSVTALVREDSEFATVGLQVQNLAGLSGFVVGRWPPDAGLSMGEAAQRLRRLIVPGLQAIRGDASARETSRAAEALRPRRLSAVWSWPHALTSDGFRALRAEVRRLEGAGFARSRAAQQPNVIALDWFQGVSDYETARADLARTFSHSRAAARGVANLYAGGGGIENIFARAFSGRIVRVVHRATDVRVEVVGCAPAEFDAIRATLSALFAILRTNKILHPQTLSQMANARAAVASAKTRRLRKLQETDPELYDLRRYEENAPVYAVLCQGDRQPRVYTEAERRRLSDSVRRRVVRYWNFTLNGPAFYDCGGPGSAYPHLGFRAGVHPLGYCLPCCKKAPPSASGSAASRAAHQRCLNVDEEEDSGAPAETDEVSATDRHVLVVGKTIPPGRLGGLPIRLKRLMSGAFGPDRAPLRLFGVPQSVPAIPDAGTFFAIAAALRRTPEALAERLAETAEALTETLGFFAEGAAAGVSSTQVAAAFRDSFVAGDPEPTVFSLGGAMEKTWVGLTESLVREVYGVVVVRFVARGPHLTLNVDTSGVELVKTRAAPALVIVETTGGAFPLVALGGRKGLWRESRRLFGSAAPDDALPADTVVDILVETCESAETDGTPLDNVRFRKAIDRSGWRATTMFGDLENRYYGAMVAGPSGETAWVPLAGGRVGETGDVPLAFAARNSDDVGSAGDLDAWFRAAGLKRPAVAKTLVSGASDAVGFLGEDGLAYFHAARPAETTSAPAVMRLPYDPREIDRALFEHQGAGVPYEIAAGARRARLRGARFRMFIAEFSNVCRTQRDPALRKRILAVIGSTRFASAAALAAMRQQLAELLAGHPADAASVQFAVASATGPAGLRAAIDSTHYEFDAVSFHRVRELARSDRSGALDALRPIMQKLVVEKDDSPAYDPPNFFQACGGGGDPLPPDPVLPPPVPPCENGRLALPAELFEPYLQILLDEIVLPMQANVVLHSAADYLDPLRFTQRKYETLETIEL